MSTAKTKKQDQLEAAIERVLNVMEQNDPLSEEYSRLVDQLDQLYKIRKEKHSNRVSTDALVAIGGNLAGIIAILSFEKTNVITTKALGFVTKSKL